MIEPLYEQGIDFLINSSPIRCILTSALRCNTTPQCKTRTVIEGLYSWYKFKNVGFELRTDKLSIEVSPEFYLEIAKALIDYAGVVHRNKVEIDFYRNILFYQWIPSTSTEFPYLVMDTQDRIKSLVSELNDLFNKTLRKFLYLGILEKVSDLFEDKEVEEASQLLKKLARKNGNARNMDTYGVMFLIEYCNKSEDEEYLKNATLRIGKQCENFLQENNVDILKRCDFITHPKRNSYSSYQIVVRGLKTPLEIQFKSVFMHENNENPASPASHKRYKDTRLNNFLNKIVDDVYGKPPLAPKKRIGITEGIPLFGISRIYQTPNGEIPAGLEELESFENIEELAEIYAKYKGV